MIDGSNCRRSLSMSGVQSTGPARHARLARASATRPTSTERGTGTALYHTRASGLSGSARANGENLAMRTTTPAEPQVPAGLSVARRAGECAGRAPSGRIGLAHLKSLLSEFTQSCGITLRSPTTVFTKYTRIHTTGRTGKKATYSIHLPPTTTAPRKRTSDRRASGSLPGAQWRPHVHYLL